MGRSRPRSVGHPRTDAMGKQHVGMSRTQSMEPIAGRTGLALLRAEATGKCCEVGSVVCGLRVCVASRTSIVRCRHRSSTPGGRPEPCGQSSLASTSRCIPVERLRDVKCQEHHIRSKTASNSSSSKSSAPLHDAPVQVFVKNLAGRSVSICAELDKDISEVQSSFADAEKLPKGCAAQLALRFTYQGHVLEDGVPLRSYGLAKGCNIHVNSVLLSRSCVRLPVTITSPFATAEGVLELPASKWSDCTLSSASFQALRPQTGMLGVTPKSVQATSGSSSSTGSSCSSHEQHAHWDAWVLRLTDIRSSPGMGHQGGDDIWGRLQHVPARISITDIESGVHVGPEYLKELDMVSASSRLHISVSLLTLVERAIEQATQGITVDSSSSCRGATCCICLETMELNDEVRQLQCNHCMHTSCTMVVLSKSRHCPLCRSDCGHMSTVATSRDYLLSDEDYDSVGMLGLSGLVSADSEDDITRNRYAFYDARGSFPTYGGVSIESSGEWREAEWQAELAEEGYGDEAYDHDGPAWSDFGDFLDTGNAEDMLWLENATQPQPSYSLPLDLRRSVQDALRTARDALRSSEEERRFRLDSQEFTASDTGTGGRPHYIDMQEGTIVEQHTQDGERSYGRRVQRDAPDLSLAGTLDYHSGSEVDSPTSSPVSGTTRWRRRDLRSDFQQDVEEVSSAETSDYLAASLLETSDSDLSQFQRRVHRHDTQYTADQSSSGQMSDDAASSLGETMDSDIAQESQNPMLLGLLVDGGVVDQSFSDLAQGLVGLASSDDEEEVLQEALLDVDVFEPGSDLIEMSEDHASEFLPDDSADDTEVEDIGDQTEASHTTDEDIGGSVDNESVQGSEDNRQVWNADALGDTSEDDIPIPSSGASSDYSSAGVDLQDLESD